MPIPLLVAGQVASTIAGAYVARKAVKAVTKIPKEAYKAVQRDKKKNKKAEEYNDKLFEKHIGQERSDIFVNSITTPKKGSLLACGLTPFGSIDHSGIYIGDGYIIEQHGEDELRKVTFDEFLYGDDEFLSRGMNQKIQIACDSRGEPLASKEVAKRAKAYFKDRKRKNKEYSIISNNCHQFSWHCISGREESLTLFSTLEKRVAKEYKKVLYWDELDTNIVETNAVDEINSTLEFDISKTTKIMVEVLLLSAKLNDGFDEEKSILMLIDICNMIDDKVKDELDWLGLLDDGEYQKQDILMLASEISTVYKIAIDKEYIELIRALRKNFQHFVLTHILEDSEYEYSDKNNLVQSRLYFRRYK